MIKYPSIFLITIFWFILLNSCQNSIQKNTLTPEKQAELISKGKRITGLGFKSLTRELIKALKDGGVQHAVGYCHLQAGSITDSLSKVYSAKISRVSDKFRNPVNKAGELDLTVIKAYRQQMEEGLDLQPHLEVTANEIIYYSPIILLNPVCLQCHGEPGKTMEQASYDFIKSQYPDDLAVSYKLGDLRGVWRIVFN